jgi:Uma2 family endonuclease
VERERLGEVFTAETGFVLRRDPDTVRAPDVAFVRAERVPQARVPGFPAMAPDLVAEVVSPYDRAVEVSGKALAWLDAGVRLVWVVDPENRTVTVHRPGGTTVLRGRDQLSGEDVLPGFALPLEELWA